MSLLSSRLFCKPGGRSQFRVRLFESAAAGRYFKAREAWRDAPEPRDVACERGPRDHGGVGVCGTCEGQSVAAMGGGYWMAPMHMRTFLTPSRGPSSLRGALGGGGALLSGLRPPPPLLPPPRYRKIVSHGEVN
jgi:hypothetical protein